MNNFIHYPDRNDLSWWIEYISRSDLVLKLSLPVINDHWFESVLDLINLLKFSYYGTDVYRLAAVLFYKIIKDHKLPDGNKRTGVLCTYIFLATNGRELLDSLDMRILAKKTAKTKMDDMEDCIEMIYALFKGNTKPTS